MIHSMSFWKSKNFSAQNHLLSHGIFRTHVAHVTCPETHTPEPQVTQLEDLHWHFSWGLTFKNDMCEAWGMYIKTVYSKVSIYQKTFNFISQILFLSSFWELFEVLVKLRIVEICCFFCLLLEKSLIWSPIVSPSVWK